MLMLAITNTEGRNGVVGVRPLQFNNARQALEAVKGQLKMHVATIHAETIHIDDNIPLVIGFVGRNGAAESVLANVMTANENAAAFLERSGVIAAYHVADTDDTEILSGYIDAVVANLATYLPTPAGAPNGAEPLTIEGLDFIVGSPLNVVVSPDGSLLGRPLATDAALVEDDFAPAPDVDVNVVAQPVVTESPVAAEAQPVINTEIKSEETAMTATNKMSKAELMRAARQLHSDLSASVPNFQPIEISFAEASRLRRFCTLKLSDLDPAVLSELHDRADEVCDCLRELAALTATQGDELEPIPATHIAEDDDFIPAPAGAAVGHEDDEEFEEVETLVEADVEHDAPLLEAEAEAEGIDLTDDIVLAEKLPALFLLTKGRLDEIEGAMATLSEFAINFREEQGVDFNAFDEADVGEAVDSGELINVLNLLAEGDWLESASFDLLYELDGSLTDVCAAAGLDVQGEVDQSGINLDAEEEDEEDADETLLDETDDNEWGIDDDEAEDEEGIEPAADLQLVQVTIVPRLVLNMVADYNGHVYTKEQRHALTALPTESGRVLNFAYGISGKNPKTGSQGAYVRAISRTASALGQLSGATVLLPASHADVTADQLAAAVAHAATGSDVNELLANVLADLHGIEVDEDGNVMIGFADEEGDETEPKVALSDLCDFEVQYSMMREHDFGPATIEVTALLNMRMPILGYATHPELISARLATLADNQFNRHNVEVYPAITFNAADRIFVRSEEYSDRNVACLPEVTSALIAQVNVEGSPWAGAVVASHRAVIETGMYGIGLLVDDSDAEQYIPLHEVTDIDVYASIGNDAAAILCAPIGVSLFNMGGDTTILLTRTKDADDEDETELDDAE